MLQNCDFMIFNFVYFRILMFDILVAYLKATE
jgi:hypothetical protein